MKTKLNKILKDFAKGLEEVKNTLQLEELEQRFFSRRSGEMTEIMKSLKELSGDAKKEFGKLANEVKKELENLYSKKKQNLDKVKMGGIADKERIDITQPKLPKTERGHLHPITQEMRAVEDVARTMGFMVEDGPELESNYYVFESLNIPEHHPARDAQDTFYIKDKPDWCMRSHVSNMQVRLMQKYGAPLRAAHPGRVFRNEALDATHGHTFYQFDAIVVDKNLNVGQLVGVIKEFLKAIFKRDVEVRIRPGHFPFVEPGFEMEMKVTFGKGENAKTKWVEVVGCGLIHPNVLKEGGLDPKEWDGFAFSLGLDRLVMGKYQLEDIRHIHGGNINFLKQF